ncbi:MULTISPECIES: hypothetical protein [Actinokineospora]|uniref:Uncharacterized protein n=1 Tax=Actinokineospora fastidiosa TaxID=1816 RepID=A0A918L604_9PSEU|nr:MULTISPECIES: hypothetical protein [Actinokineospora]UVS77162.1 hypothetical protein Actkin_00864 [Actinokineospora sp. UTMC 2448]GGS13030.1 hypothetical protein GCM10010171_00950 [Actinokineospora fastidiosa]
MYVDNPGAGWQVEPDQVREFAAAVEDVRRDLDAIMADVAALSDPGLEPMLGTSPVGEELSAKFTDRLSGEHGLRGQLEAALRRMDEFVASAEKSAQGYQGSDENAADRFRFT